MNDIEKGLKEQIAELQNENKLRSEETSKLMLKYGEVKEQIDELRKEQEAFIEICQKPCKDCKLNELEEVLREFAIPVVRFLGMVHGYIWSVDKSKEANEARRKDLVEITQVVEKLDPPKKIAIEPELMERIMSKKSVPMDKSKYLSKIKKLNGEFDKDSGDGIDCFVMAAEERSAWETKTEKKEKLPESMSKKWLRGGTKTEPKTEPERLPYVDIEGKPLIPPETIEFGGIMYGKIEGFLKRLTILHGEKIYTVLLYNIRKLIKEYNGMLE